MVIRRLGLLVAGVTSLIGTAALACPGPGPGCVYTPASSAYAIAPSYQNYEAHHAAAGPCDACAAPAPAPVTYEDTEVEAPPLNDAFFYGGLSGGAGPGIDVAGEGGFGGGEASDQFTGSAAANAAASALGSAYARSTASATAMAYASATASASGMGMGGGWGHGGGGWGHGGGCGCVMPKPRPPPPHGCGCGHHR